MAATEAVQSCGPADHRVLGRINAWGFRFTDGYFHAKYGVVKRELFGGLPRTVVEIGAGAGANLRYLDRGSHVIAIEPNTYMHPYLLAAGRRCGVSVDVRAGSAERIPLPDASVDAVISSLVLCSVADPARVLGEIRRVLRPGGRFHCVEHVAAPRGMLAVVQHAVARPWRWFFEGCHTRRDIAGLLGAAGFSSVEVKPFTLRTAILPIRPQIAATAVK